MWEEEGHGTCNEAGGCVSLVSDGVDPHGTEIGVISASGDTIGFQTQRGLSPADTDGVGDVYVAQVDGGFHTPHPPAPCGSAEACRPASTPEPPAPVLGSEQIVTGGNGAGHLQCAKGRHRVVRHGQPRCVKIHSAKRHRKNQDRGASAHHRVHANRGGSK
jgi:hypothetical protein